MQWYEYKASPVLFLGCPPPRCLSWSASTLFVVVCLHVVCRGLPPRCLSWSASTLFVVVCLHVVCRGLPPRCLSWSASTLLVVVCLHVVCHGLPPRCLSWSASTLFVVVCLHVVCRGLPPTVPLHRDRFHFPSNVDHLYSRLVDLTVLRICNLSDVDNDVHTRVTSS